MGMNATIRRLSDDDLSSLLDDPELVPGYLDARHTPEGFGPFRDLNLEESWHAIHFLLTGSAWAGKAPLNFVATGGKELGEDSGHGPARCLSANQVRKLAAGYEDLFGEKLPPIAHAWAGSFATTRDGLPYIGRVPGLNPRLQFALCYGGNGITFAVHAGDIVRAGIEGRPHELDPVFGFGRMGTEQTRPGDAPKRIAAAES